MFCRDKEKREEAKSTIEGVGRPGRRIACSGYGQSWLDFGPGWNGTRTLSSFQFSFMDPKCAWKEEK